MDTLATLAQEVDEVKVKIKEKKLEKGLSMEEACTWSKEIDTKIEGVDTEIEHLRKCLNEMRRLAEKVKEDELRSIERQKQLEFG